MTTLQLYKHQEQVLKENPARILLAHSTGTGKTITAIELINKNCLTALIVVPKMLKEKWQEDIKKHGKERMVTLILSKEEFKKMAPTLPAFDGVVCDEAHYFAGMQATSRGPKSSQMHRAMNAYMKKHNIKFRYLLTATPYLSTPLNIFALARLLGHDWDYNKFINKFFWEIEMGHRVVFRPKNHIEEQVATLVSRIGHIVDMEEIVVVPEQYHEDVVFPLSEAQKTAKEEYAYTESTYIEQWTTEHQIENGFVYTDGENFEVIPECPKLKFIGIMAETTKKMAIFCRYKAQMYMIQAKLFAMGKEVFMLHGGIDNRHEIINQVNASEDCVVIIQTACSAGYELPTIGTIIFASLSFSYVDYEQALGRFLRINKLKENRYIHLVTEGVDNAVYNSIMNKRDFSFEIYGKNNKNV